MVGAYYCHVPARTLASPIARYVLEYLSTLLYCVRAGALCDKDQACRSFSLMNANGGAGALHSQLFAGGGSCLRSNHDWTSYVKSSGKARPRPAQTTL